MNGTIAPIGTLGALVAMFSRSSLRLIRLVLLFALAAGIWGGVEVSVSVPVDGGVVAQMGVGSVVWAAGAADSDPASQALRSAPASDTSTTGLSVINGSLNLMFAIITPFMMLAGWLLTPDWVFGEIFGLRTVLHDLWVLMSNMVYIAFAFLLIAMAFMNIYAGEKNTWAIKAKLPKLIVGVISVPFTWFFVSAVLSISSVLTASVMQLAGDLRPTGTALVNIPTYDNCTIDFTASANQPQ